MTQPMMDEKALARHLLASAASDGPSQAAQERFVLLLGLPAGVVVGAAANAGQLVVESLLPPASLAPPALPPSTALASAPSSVGVTGTTASLASTAVGVSVELLEAVGANAPLVSASLPPAATVLPAAAAVEAPLASSVLSASGGATAGLGVATTSGWVAWGSLSLGALLSAGALLAVGSSLSPATTGTVTVGAGVGGAVNPAVEARNTAPQRTQSASVVAEPPVTAAQPAVSSVAREVPAASARSAEVAAVKRAVVAGAGNGSARAANGGTLSSAGRHAPADLGAELAALEAARTALAHDDTESARRLLDSYERTFPGGALADEARRLRARLKH